MISPARRDAANIDRFLSGDRRPNVQIKSDERKERYSHKCSQIHMDLFRVG